MNYFKNEISKLHDGASVLVAFLRDALAERLQSVCNTSYLSKDQRNVEIRTDTERYCGK